MKLYSSFILKSIGQSKNPTRYLFIATLAILGLTYSVMILGVYLSSIHQGLSCLTWPLCPNGFDFPPPNYFYEHFHRTLVFVLLISVVTFTSLTYIKIRNQSLRSKLTLATGLLLIQIFIGWFMIYTKLNPLVVAGHLATGIAFFGILLVTLLSLYHQMNKVKQINKE
ncbi:MAG: COX15/CtaA family protein [Candidatus Nitrosocosmicus sp.]